MTTTEHVDVLIIGAGLSGIGAAAHLVKDLPGTTYAILERRAASGGTWLAFWSTAFFAVLSAKP